MSDSDRDRENVTTTQKKSPGRPRRSEKTVGDVREANMIEPLAAQMHVKMQPSLKAAFEKKCLEAEPTPLVPSDVIRGLMNQWIKSSHNRRFL